MVPSDNPSREWVELEAKVERKDPSLPRFITVPSASVETWNLTSTSPVEVEIDAVSIGRRSLKYWRERDSWFFDLTERHCRDLGIDRGDVVEVRITPADPSPPAEIQALLDRDASARRRWDRLSPSRQRTVSEHVRAGKREATRRRRAGSALETRSSS